MIRLNGISKAFGKKRVLNELELNVGEGELFGFIGPNGAGKTTTMKILAGLIKPDSGEASIHGLSLLTQPEAVKAQIGYMPDFFGVYDNLTTREYMEFFADIYHIPVREQKKLILELLELVKLSKEAEALVDTLSRGMKQKLCLARTLIHKPKILLLDEPGSGMEPAARVEMKEILTELSKQGTTIMISSHILSELSELCTDIGIIDNGKIILRGSKEEIMRQANRNSQIEITILEGAEEAMRILKSHSTVKNIVKAKEVLSVQVEGTQLQEAEILTDLVQHGVIVASYKKYEGSLESLFLRLTKG